MVIKDPTMMKVLEEKIKSNNLESQNHWDVKEYKPEKETDE